MMNTRAYFLVLLLPVMFLSPAALFLKFHLQPIEGDLTRIGGYSENDFGWNLPQSISLNKTTQYARSLSDVSSYHPVVVFGDSFSHVLGERAFSWQQQLADEAGLTSLTFHTNRVSVEDFLKSPLYSDKPPSIVVYQFVERSLKELLERAPEICPVAVRHSGNGLVMQELGSNAGQVGRMKEQYSRELEGVSLDEVMAYVRQKLILKKRVFRNELNRDDLFSNDKSDQVLWLYKDLKKYELSEEELGKIGCYLAGLQNAVESNGITRMVIMIASDKSSIYAPYMVQPPFSIRDTVSLIDKPNLNLVRLDKDLQASVSNGAKDVYLPNDTHWGSLGNTLAAQSIITFLSKRNVVSH